MLCVACWLGPARQHGATGIYRIAGQQKRFTIGVWPTWSGTFASLLVSGGASLEMIGRLLGHTQIGTTQRYAHLIDAPLRARVNAVGEMLKPRLRVVGE